MTTGIEVVGPVAIVTIDNPPVNAASQGVRQGLVEAVATIEADEAVKIAILICAGRTFVAGADVREFGKAPSKPFLPDVVSAVENASKSWIAAIHGTALGGGLEIALGCHYRIADRNAKMGLPEVNLGLIPGAGGTVRLPRLIGAEAALDMMATGKPISAGRAIEVGLVDQVCDDSLRAEALKFALKHADLEPPLSIPDRPPTKVDQSALDAQIQKITIKAKGQNSPKAVCKAVQNAIDLPASSALEAERQLFLQLKDDPQSIALRHVFFAERAAAKLPSVRDIRPAPIKEVGVIGGGTMGAGIAASVLLAGMSVLLVERDSEAVDAGVTRIAGILSNSLKRGLITVSAHQLMMGQLKTTTDYKDLGGADLIIEAVFEDMDVKREVFTQLDQVSKPDVILASNTSYLDVQEIADSVKDPSRVIGLHFFSPAHIMKLLELVIPTSAAPVTIATGLAFSRKLGKITVPSGVCDGFIGNRIMSAYRRECDYMIEDGALPADIDAAMRNFGFPMGVFEMQDLAGLDIGWAMRKRRAPSRDPSERYVEIADKLCEAGRFGRKTGRGWYHYNGKSPEVDPIVTRLIEETSVKKGIKRRQFLEPEIIDRILETMQVEGQKILEEDIAAKPGDIDVVMINGYGFPRWRGGPMFMAAARAQT